MDIRNRRGLKAAAADALAQAPGHRRLVLVWAGISAVASLLVTLISFILDNQIQETGGLDGIGLRSALSTTQSLLRLLLSAAIPFWNLGYLRAVLGLSRQERVHGSTLLAGFRRFGPALRLELLRGLLYVLAIIIGFNAATVILSFTPLAAPFNDFLLANEELIASGVLDEATLDAAVTAMTPMFIGCAVASAIALIPVSYRLRLANLRIMDNPGCGAVAAAMESNRLMKRNCMALFRLDLSFWWYYLAQAVLIVVFYGDMLLAALGIPMPFSDDVAFFLFYLVATAAQLVLLYFCSNPLEVTYAKFYDVLSAPPAETAAGQE